MAGLNISIAHDTSIEYDSQGRMKFHPAYHARQKLPWTTGEERYLIDNYDVLGPEQVSLALERTINSVMRYACNLRKKGKLPVPKKKRYHRRTMTARSTGTESAN